VAEISPQPHLGERRSVAKLGLSSDSTDTPRPYNRSARLKISLAVKMVGTWKALWASLRQGGLGVRDVVEVIALIAGPDLVIGSRSGELVAPPAGASTWRRDVLSTCSLVETIKREYPQQL
jgi:hypothetical protein